MDIGITYSIYTDAGSRAVNEDSVIAFGTGERRGFVLCDGLGGMGMGDLASQLAVHVFEDIFNKTDKMKKYLPVAFQAAQDIVTGEQKRLHAEAKMKTTAVALALDRKKAYIGHIGDSRLYIFRNGEVFRRTLDHSIPQMLALTGDIEESEIRHHKKRGILLKTIGVEWDKPMYELMKPISLSKCDAFLLCSDGFWELIEDQEMSLFLRNTSGSEEWLDAMSKVVRERGEHKDMDNNSAIAVRLVRG